MDLDATLARVKELTAQREAIDTELRSLFSGEAPKPRKPQQCSVCHQEGHSARTCPTKTQE